MKHALELKEPLLSLTHLLMAKAFAALQRFLAKLRRLNEAGFLLQIPAYGFLSERLGIAPFVRGSLRKLLLLFWREADFHGPRVWASSSGRQRRCNFLPHPSTTTRSSRAARARS